MKNSTFRFAKIFAIAFMGITAVACHTEDTRTAENLNDSKLLSSTVLLPMPADCNSVCITEGNYYSSTQEKTVSWGGKNNDQNTKTVTVEYYNTETDFVIRVKSTNDWSDLILNGVSVWTGGKVLANNWGTYSFKLSDGWKACDAVNLTLGVAGQGPKAEFAINYNLVGVCPPCKTEFTGIANSCSTDREVTYTFETDKDVDYFKMQGGLTNFTGSNATVTVTGGNDVKVTQSTPGGSSNRIIKIEGGADSCGKVTVNVKWYSTNSGGIVTGEWSIKDAEGNELAPSVGGLSCN